MQSHLAVWENYRSPQGWTIWRLEKIQHYYAYSTIQEEDAPLMKASWQICRKINLDSTNVYWTPVHHPLWLDLSCVRSRGPHKTLRDDISPVLQHPSSPGTGPITYLEFHTSDLKSQCFCTLLCLLFSEWNKGSLF